MNEINKSLKDCPFCGGKAEIYYGYNNLELKTLGYSFISCTNCGCQTNIVDEKEFLVAPELGNSFAVVEASNLWNQRNERINNDKFKSLSLIEKYKEVSKVIKNIESQMSILLFYLNNLKIPKNITNLISSINLKLGNLKSKLEERMFAKNPQLIDSDIDIFYGEERMVEE